MDGRSAVEATARAGQSSDRLDPVLGCFIRRFDTTEAARQVDEAAEAGPLRGMTIGVKDVLATRECPTTAQSRVHDVDWYSGAEATAVRRLRAAGGVIVGKTTLAEHAIGRPDPECGFPVPRNPWALDRWTGGSSCGSAAGVPAGLFTVGIGTDTNGSLRIPGALCGVSALKPTRGKVPDDGCLPLAASLDTIGPLATSVRECVRVLAVMAGECRVEESWRDRLEGVRIGVSAELEAALGPSPDCGSCFERAKEELSRLGANIVAVELPELSELLAAQLVILLSEGFDVHGERLRASWWRLGRSFRRTMALGGLLSDENYVSARRSMSRLTRSFLARILDVDAVIVPTWPDAAPRYDDAAGMGKTSGVPGLANVTGAPAMAVPMGFSADGLPLSLQFLGAPGSETRLAVLADAYQRATGWHEHSPELDAHYSPAPVAFPAPASDVAHSSELSGRLAMLGLDFNDSDLAAMEMLWERVSVLA